MYDSLTADEIVRMARDWTAIFGLNLADPDDRALFRSIVERKTRRTRMGAMLDWTATLTGVRPHLIDRAGTVRSLADALIVRFTEGPTP